MCKSNLLLSSLLSLLIFASQAAAYSDTPSGFSRDTLRGIDTITVTVEPPAQYIYGDLSARGITTEKLQAEVTARLQQAGLQVISFTEALDVPEAALLKLRISLVRSSKGIYSYGVYLTANRKVILGSDTSFESIRVWSDYLVGGTSISLLREIEGYAYDLVDDFIRDYQRQN